MHQTQFCAFLGHDCVAEEWSEVQSWERRALVLASQAHLLSCWIAEDAPESTAVPALLLAASEYDAPNDIEAPNVATAYECGLFPHIDPPSNTARHVLGLQAIDEEELQRLVWEELLSPWPTGETVASERVMALGREFLEEVTHYFRDAYVAETVNITDNMPVPEELHLVVATSGDELTRLSVLRSATAPARRDDLIPDPACSFGGHACPDKHVLDQDAADRAHVALRAVSAGATLSLRLSDCPWTAELNGDEKPFDVAEWYAALDGLRTECLNNYIDHTEDIDDHSLVYAAVLGDEMFCELLDIPLRRISGPAPQRALHITGSCEDGDWLSTERPSRFVLFGPTEAIFLQIDAVDA
ncbi:hypothetical protein [Actinomadura oligospora]|uniref:hypothetical protein n=1 Tax=Actinomadura oligospora TaxID=111804 RepID=UPI00047D3D3A|nr:hypothetical protein [Actinomadura oligospora]